MQGKQRDNAVWEGCESSAKDEDGDHVGKAPRESGEGIGKDWSYKGTPEERMPWSDVPGRNEVRNSYLTRVWAAGGR